MYATTLLQWLFNGVWHRIGWVASDPKSAADLREHGQRMTDTDPDGGRYRLVMPSHKADEPPVVIYEYERLVTGGN